MCEPRIVQAGIERENSGQAPRHGPAADQESRERAAEVRHGERQDRRIDGQRRRPLIDRGPLARQQSTSAYVVSV